MTLQSNVSPGVWEVVEPAYETGNYTDAILESIRYLSELIRNKSGLDSDGNALIGGAFGGLSPIVKVNLLQTESERDEQRGMEQILRGIYTGIRNPRSHEKRVDTAETADVLIRFIDYLCSQIDKSRSPFDSEQIIGRVFDKHFAQNEKYADLLVARIPQRKRLDVLVQVFKRRTEGGWKNISFFAKSVMKTLTNDEQGSFWQVVSDAFEEASADAEFRSALQIVGDDWLKVSEIARLRVEHRLIESIREGEYDKHRKVCIKGALGTWANGIASQFSLQDELVRAITGRLCSDEIPARDYGLEYFWPWLRSFKSVPPRGLVWCWKKRLAEHDQTIYNVLELVFIIEDEDDEWVKAFKEAFEKFEAPQSDESAEVADDDIPF